MSDETKQTAVEWLIEQLEEQGHSWENASIKTIEISIKVEDYLKLKQQAKEMEKERIKNRAVESYYLYTQYLEQIPKIGGATVEMDFEQWYKETYGGNK